MGGPPGRLLLGIESGKNFSKAQNGRRLHTGKLDLTKK